MTLFGFVERERAHFAVTMLCRVLGVSPSGYWAWRTRIPSRRWSGDAELRDRIGAIHAASRGTYGAPRLHAELAAAGIRTGRKRVARLMRELGLAGVHRRRSVSTTRRDRTATAAPDLVGRDFHPDGPDRLWVADITLLPTREGPLHLATVLDAWSRMAVGWSMAARQTSELVTRALEAALAQRRPGGGLIHHSDHGSQYTSLDFGRRLRAAGISASMGRVGDSYDNAMAESFFASLETELIDRTAWRSHREARRDVFAWIELFYNRVRRHSALGYLSPSEFEARYRIGGTTT